jgi:hypothetical protein
LKDYGILTNISDVKSGYINVAGKREQQLEEVSQFEGWLRHSSATFTDEPSDWS